MATTQEEAAETCGHEGLKFSIAFLVLAAPRAIVAVLVFNSLRLELLTFGFRSSRHRPAPGHPSDHCPDHPHEGGHAGTSPRLR